MNKLERAYAMVPDANCKGLCQDCCGPVIPSFAEESRIKERHGVEVAHDKATLTCTLLHEGRCDIYADRPLLCRLWGVVQKMPCPFGCAPDDGVMKRRDERKALALVYGPLAPSQTP